MWCRDVQQLRADLGVKALPLIKGTAHNALDDARWTMECWEFLKELSRQMDSDRIKRILDGAAGK